jgi:hypothetical protein
MARKRNKGRKSTRPEVVDVDLVDRGTALTRQRLMAETLTADHLQAHQITAGFEMRSALEEGIGAKAFDMVAIGMSGGAKSSVGGWVPKERLLTVRWRLEVWRLKCTEAGIQASIVEDYVQGASRTKIAETVHIRRQTVARIIAEGLDLYADTFLIRRKPVAAPMQAWEADPVAVTAAAVDPEVVVHALPETARLTKRNIRK